MYREREDRERESEREREREREIGKAQKIMSAQPPSPTPGQHSEEEVPQEAGDPEESD